MAGVNRPHIDFQTSPDRYRHWQLRIDPPIAFLTMNVDESGGLDAGYELKLNSYDLGVDIELYDATQRLRFEHPEVGAVVITSALDRVFCAGANIKMLGQAAHSLKVNFCKFTNETRNAIEDASENSGQPYVAGVNGNAAGGGYELALACDYLILTDDGSSSVAMPEVPLLAVLPGTGGLTRLTDKRKVRRDRADVFCTLEEGIKGTRAVDWGLVDEIAPTSRFSARVKEKALELAARTDRPADAAGVVLTPLDRQLGADEVVYPNLRIDIDRTLRTASLTLLGPSEAAPVAIESVDADFWPLALARELDDALLHLRLNEPEVGLLLLRTEGDSDLAAA
ncbi:MAG: enoyl-CoA hydratase-related protein, partial [Acidimicrobiia bacterium]